MRRYVRSCLRSARTARRIEAGLIALAASALVLASAVRSAGREPLLSEWWLAGICGGLGAVAWLAARRVQEFEIASQIDDALELEGEWRTAWEVETGRLPRTALAEALVRRAPHGITRADLRDVVTPAALPLLALPFLACGLYAFCLDQVREEKRREFEWASVTKGLDARDMRAAVLAAAGTDGAPMSEDATAKFQEAIRSGSALARELEQNRADPEAVREAVEASEEALERFEQAAEEEGALTPEVAATLAERRTLLDAARLQLAQADSAEAGSLDEIEASPSLEEGSPGTMPGPKGSADPAPSPGRPGLGEANSAGGAVSEPPSSAPSPPERRPIPPVLPGRSFEARYDGVVSRFLQSMTSPDTD